MTQEKIQKIVKHLTNILFYIENQKIVTNEVIDILNEMLEIKIEQDKSKS